MHNQLLFGCLMISALASRSSGLVWSPGARFSKAPESFRTRKAMFRSSVSNNGEVYTLETSCMKGTSLHPYNVNKTSLYSQGSRFCNGFTGPKGSGAFEKRPPGQGHCVAFLGETLYSHSAPLHSGISMGSGEFNAGVTPPWSSILSRGSRNRLSRFILQKPERSAGVIGRLARMQYLLN